MADVALVGFPNVGKSTLISVISAAKPKIADYPFTTLEPNLGVVRLDDATEFVVADIPGLIEGASEGKGLGHQFLRHVERARVLCLLVDLAALDGTSPAEQERILLAELGDYRPELLERPRLVVGTKADITGTTDPAELGFQPDGESRFVISAVTGDGLAKLVGAMARLVHEARQAHAGDRGRGAAAPAADRRGGVARWARTSSASAGATSSASSPSTTSRRPRRCPTSGTASSGSASTSCSPAPAPPTATSCGSATSASSTGTPDVRLVVKVGTSSVTDERGAVDDGAIAKLAGEVAELRACGHEVDRRVLRRRGRRRRRARARPPGRRTRRRCRRWRPPANRA